MLVLKQPNDYFENSPSYFCLDKLYLTFYQAIHAELIGDLARAKSLFKSLEAVPCDFYAVAQAKQWLMAKENKGLDISLQKEYNKQISRE